MKTFPPVAFILLALLIWTPTAWGQGGSAPIVFNYDCSKPRVRWKVASHGQDVIVMATVPKGHETATLYLESASHTVATTFVPKFRGYFGFSVNKDELGSGTYSLIISFKDRRQPNLTVGKLNIDDGFLANLTQRSGTEQQHYKTALRLASTTLATVPITTSSAGNGEQQSTDELGTGLIVSASGIVVTCEHVVRNAKSITFRYRNAVYTAVPVKNPSTDKWAALDIAVLKSETMPNGGFVTAYLAAPHDIDQIARFLDDDENSGPLNWVSLGYPALEPATMRSLNVESWRIRTGVASFNANRRATAPQFGTRYDYENAFDVTWRGLKDDAELDGMSGGPLLTETGYVIGILQSAGIGTAPNGSGVHGLFIPTSLVVKCQVPQDCEQEFL